MLSEISSCVDSCICASDPGHINNGDNSKDPVFIIEDRNFSE